MKILGVIFVTLCFMANAEAGSSMPVEKWIQNVAWIDEGERAISKDETKAYIDEASEHIRVGANNPIFYYFCGRLTSISQGHYMEDLMAKGKRYRLNAPENQALIKKYQSYYQKAMELDDNPDAPEHLTAMMLIRIGSDSVGDPAIKVRAQEKVAALARAGKDGTGNEMLEWNTYEARLDIYVDAKDYDNALKIVDEMIERYSSTEELEGYKRHFEEVIAKRDNAAATVDDTYAQAEPYAESIEEVVAEPQAVEPYAEAVAEDVAETSKPVPVAKVAKPKLEPQADAQESNVMLWLLGGALLGLIWFAFRRRKHSA